jgi:hypothetical protein
MLGFSRTLCGQPTTGFRLLVVAVALFGAFGCKPKIGEDCAISTDCSLTGDRLCDLTQPGGYCTTFNCEPNGCPEEAACTAFSEGTCSTVSVSQRLRRTFCMRTCEDDGDCRGGAYRCLDTTNDPGRTVVDTNPSSRRICAVPDKVLAPDAPPPSRDPATCFPSDASFDTARPEAGPARDANADNAEATNGDARRDSDVTSIDAADTTPVEAGDGAPDSDDAATDDVDDAADAADAAIDVSVD